MNQTLPAYLQGKPARQGRIAEAAASGIGSSLPPHISIQGNAFTLIDAANTENPVGATLDAVIVDVCDVVAKMYYGGKKWEPGSNDPPLCWSSNGVGPSVDALEPPLLEVGPRAGQVPQTCNECPKNVRGSAVSAISGVAIKACRDEKLVAVMPIQFPSMMFQMRITPGSFTNWRDYLKKFEGQQFDLNDVVTRLAFQPKVNGVLTFTGVAHLSDMAIIQARNAALIEKKTDVLVGRLDRPREGLPAPLPQGQLAAPAAAPNAASQSIATAPAQTQTAFGAPAASPSEAPTGARRGRKPKDPPAAGNGGQAPAGTQAPFMQGAPPATPAAGGFGIQAGVEPNAELQAALSIFDKP